jgi:ABC-type uncharacterized transport system permease subunit/ABC-type uncharacterized transport system substrate-binding protein
MNKLIRSVLLILIAQNLVAQTPTVGFLEAFQDETLAQAKEGFFKALAENGFSEKAKTLKVIYRNAQGDMPTLVQAADYLISQNVDLIATNPTTATITAIQKTKEIPICMMVSPHPNLVGLIDKKGNYPANLTGVYETLDYIASSVEMMKMLLPQAKTIGVIYNQAEPQSINALKVLQKKAKELGLKVLAKPVNNSSEAQLVTKSLLSSNIDAFFAMPDNVVFAAFEVIFKACSEANIPVFTSEEGLVKRGAVASFGANMFEWGYQAGLMAVAYLKTKKIRPIEPVKTHQKIYNSTIATQFKIKVDSDFTDVADDKAKIKLPTASKTSAGNPFIWAVLLEGLGYASLAMGIFISMRIFDIPDITTDGSYTLGGAVSAVLLMQGVSLMLALPMVLLAGAMAGICTGLIHTKLKVNALLAGILVMTALYSVNLTVMGKSNIPLLDRVNLLDTLAFLTGSLYSQLIILCCLIGFLWLFLSYLLNTDFGLAMRATGNAEIMIRANGVNTDTMKILGLGIANALVALSGFLFVQNQGFADINMGIGIVIVGLGSVMIGETLSGWLGFRKVALRMLGVVLGTIIFRMMLALTLALGVDNNLLRLVTALFVLLVVGLPTLLKRK